MTIELPRTTEASPRFPPGFRMLPVSGAFSPLFLELCIEVGKALNLERLMARVRYRDGKVYRRLGVSL